VDSAQTAACTTPGDGALQGLALPSCPADSAQTAACTTPGDGAPQGLALPSCPADSALALISESHPDTAAL
jgi:hypothetical protein